MRWSGYTAYVGERIYAYTILIGKPEEKRRSGRFRRRRDDPRADNKEL
jgi:hypothetical protein